MRLLMFGRGQRTALHCFASVHACASAAFHPENVIKFVPRAVFQLGHAPLPLQLDLDLLKILWQSNRGPSSKLGTNGRPCVFRGGKSGLSVCSRNCQITALT